MNIVDLPNKIGLLEKNLRTSACVTIDQMGATIWKLVKFVIAVSILLTALVVLFFKTAPTFGAQAGTEGQVRIQQSPNFNGKTFVNLVPTVVSTPDPASETDFSLLEFFLPTAGKNPTEPLPSRRFDPASFENGDFVWFGHSTILFKTDGLTVLTDPVFNRASPIPFTVSPFPVKVDNPIEVLPKIDIVLISHDHYDHLDHKAIGVLANKVERFLVPLGVKSHLLRWGIAEKKVDEFDWYESTQHQTLELTFAPSRHFSGRRSFNADTTLWGSWIARSSAQNVYFSGDGGYFEEFKHIGETYGPFDIAFVENGAYDVNWSQIHLKPEESVQASIDLRAQVFFPIHWAKFDLALHHWTEPVVRAKAAAERNQVKLATPRIGQVFTLFDYPSDEWWLEVE